jgi:hypothetical protein
MWTIFRRVLPRDATRGCPRPAWLAYAAGRELASHRNGFIPIRATAELRRPAHRAAKTARELKREAAIEAYFLHRLLPWPRRL